MPIQRSRRPALDVYTAVHTKVIRLPAMKNITLSAEEGLIAAARERARSENTTLNEQFRAWLASYAAQRTAAQGVAVITKLQAYARTGGAKFTREQMNER